MYNLTNLTSATNIGQVAVYANNASDGVLFGFLSIAMFIIMLLALKRYEFDDSLLTASFLSFLLAGIAAYAGLLNIIFPLGYLIILALTGMYVWIVKR